MKRSTYEDDLQIAVAQWLDIQGWLWFHPDNEGLHKPQYRAKRRKKGVKPGVPDVMIYEPCASGSIVLDKAGVITASPTKRHVGLAIELKCPHIKPGTDPRYPNGVTKTYPNPEQKQWLADLEACGWLVKVCRTLDEVIAVCEAVRRDGR